MMTSAYILSDGNTASTDYFLFPYLESIGYSPYLVDTRQMPGRFQHGLDKQVVVLSRYLPLSWRDTLASWKKEGSKIVYFMDDDLFDIHVLRGLPWRYRWKIVRLAMSQQRRLKELCTEFWVSTPYLAQKYAELKPRLITASPSPQLIHSYPPLVRICYHATSSHRSELHWLADVLRRVQLSSSNTHFELFGDSVIKRHYRGIPRVSILHAMNWSQYLAWSGSVRRDIALAPLLRNAFNRARGPTKFFDYARMGAAGIYTAAPPYQGFIRDGVDGLLVENDPEQWAKAILGLVTDEEKRGRIATAARNRALGATMAEDLNACGSVATSFPG